MIYSVIEIETWKRCHRKWDLTSDNRQNLEAIKYAAPLILGSIVHESVALKTDDPQTDLVESFKERATNAITRIEENYKEQVGAAIHIDEAQPVYESLALGLAMMKAYQKFYKTPLPDHYKSIHTEQRMIVPIPGTEHYECDGRHHHILRREQVIFRRGDNGEDLCSRCDGIVTWQSHFLRGTMDNLVQDIRNGLMYALERKTYGNRPKVEKLQNDTQMIAYEWMLCQLFGYENIGGTLYDGIWKRDSESKYFKSHYQIDDLFFRHLFVHPREQLDEYAYYLPSIVNEMANAEAPDLYYNRRWEGCYDCGMVQLCDAISRDEDIEYVTETYYQQRTDANRLADPED